MSQYTTIKDIPYTLTNPHPRQLLDLYLPTPTSTATQPSPPSPIIVYIHGGAFKYGSKESEHVPLRQLNHNYAIAALNYRRSGEALFPAMIQDCKSAVRFLRSPDVAGKYNLDVERVVVWGESAGGHAAAFLGCTSPMSTSRSQSEGDETKYDVGDFLDVSSGVSGVVDYYGPTDFLSMDAHLPEGYQTHGDVDSPESLYLGAQIKTVPELVREADPCSHVEGLVQRYKNGDNAGGTAAPRFFIAHGTADRIVPEHMSRLLVAELEKWGVEVEYLPVDGTDHVFRGISDGQQGELDERTDRFLGRVFGL